MSFQRLVCILIGAWIAGSLFMGWIAAENFKSVERLLNDPSANAAGAIKQLGYHEVRQFLRYQVAEQNRFYFENWELMQMFLGTLIFGILLFATKSGRYTLALPLGMLSLVMLTHFLITPRIIALGRLLDFMPSNTLALDEMRFQATHRVYGVVEAIKIVLGIVLSGVLVVHRSRRKLREKIDVVNYADHSHVNG